MPECQWGHFPGPLDKSASLILSVSLFWTNFSSPFAWAISELRKTATSVDMTNTRKSSD
jgi:hypothetical protein